MIELHALSREDMETIRKWRAGCMETLRTPFLLTREMQEQYYESVICNRNSTTRYWALRLPVQEDGETFHRLVGYGGLENIIWENRNGEISLLISPDYRGKGYGRQAVELFLEQAFEYINLENVHGEVYKSGHWKFWQKILEDYQGFATWLPERKYYRGIYYPSMYFNFNRNDWRYVQAMRKTELPSGVA